MLLMKIFLFTTIILLSMNRYSAAADVSSDSAAIKTLFSLENTNQGFIISPILQFSSVEGNFCILSGIRAGLVFSHKYTFSFSYYSTMYSDAVSLEPDPITGDRPVLNLTHFGFEFEYNYNPHKLLHYGFICHLGAGNIGYKPSEKNMTGNTENHLYTPDYGSDWFFIIEPGLQAEINISSWIRADAGAGYRFAFGAEYSRLGETTYGSSLSAPYAWLALKFGSF